MTREELAIRVKEARGCVAEGDPCGDHGALAAVADERDAAIKQRDRALALLRECDPPDEPEWNDRRRALLAEVDG